MTSQKPTAPRAQGKTAATPPGRLGKRAFVVYTVLTGAESPLHDPFPADSGDFERICFTDDLSIDPNGWKLIKLESPFLDPPRESRRPKLLPHLYLPEFEWSLYVDNSIKLKMDPLRILALHSGLPHNFWTFKHPDRDCVYDEAEVVIRLRYDQEGRVREQMQHYERLGYPRKAGLSAHGMLLRRHNHPDVIRLGELWYQHVLRFSKRDQLSFNFVARQLDFSYGLFEGGQRDNQFMIWPGFPDDFRMPRDFDETAYQRLNPQVVTSGLSARQHYATIGVKEGLAYKDQEPDPEEQILQLRQQIEEKDLSIQIMTDQAHEHLAQIAEKQKAVDDLDLVQQRAIRSLSYQLGRKGEVIQELSAKAAEQEHAIQSISAQVVSLSGQVASLSDQLRDKDREVVAARVESGSRVEGLRSLQAYVTSLQARVESLQYVNETLQSGIAFRLLSRYRLFIERLLPWGSRRRSFYDVLTRGFRVLVAEGPRAAWQRIRDRSRRETPPPAVLPPLPAPPSLPALPASPPVDSEFASSAEAPAEAPSVDQKYTSAYFTALGNALTETRPDYVPLLPEEAPSPVMPVKLIAFYLPQFHPIAENDRWWGRGFSEWRNVAKAAPQFAGHYQPRLPGELGFYDLRVPDVQRRQVELARMYGVHGFCFHYYWFNGKRLLERPVDQFLQDPEIDFPFCLCWANENWTRRWDGQEDDILIAQENSVEGDFAFIRDIEPILRHRNYIKIDGRPLLVVYRANVMPEPARTAERWRQYCREVGLGEIYLVAAQTFGFFDPRKVGFDAAVEFPPHNVMLNEVTGSFNILNPAFSGRIYSYDEIADKATRLFKAPEYKVFKTVFPGWDNDARKPGRGYTFAFASPDAYQKWLEKSALMALQAPEPDERLVFINAWNEWGEGAYLEPDQRYGYAFLQATANALNNVQAEIEGPTEFHLPLSFRRHDTAVVLHLYYEDLWPEIASHLANLDGDFDLYVSTPIGAGDLGKIVTREYPEAIVYHCKNRGRDLGPFVEILSAIDPLDYKYICKIHTKRSTHREDGTAWRQDLFQKLLGSPEIVRAVKQSFDSTPEVGIIAPQGHVVPGSYFWGENADNVADLARRAELPFEGPDFHFVAGSMFWFRPAAIRQLAALHITADDFEPELGQRDGTLAHALERLIGLVSRRNGFDILEVDESGGQQIASDADAAYPHAVPTDSTNRAVSLDPIIVYQMGRVGSLTVHQSLGRAYAARGLSLELHHIHMLNNLEKIAEGIKKVRADYTETLKVIQAGMEVRQAMDDDPDRNWNVISLVREPIGRNVSAFFYNLFEILPDWQEKYAAGELSMDALQDLFVKQAAINLAPENWFDTQMLPVFDVDVFAAPFPVNQGYQMYSGRSSRVLLLRLEDLDRCAAEAMYEFLGLPDFTLVRQNVGDEKDYGPIYREFRRRPLPAEYIVRMYGTKFARHFYTLAELEAFSLKWARGTQAQSGESS